MSAYPDVEDIQTTWTEKLLAIVLTAFLVLGAVWTYTRIDDAVGHHVKLPTATVEGSPAVARQSAAQERVFRAQNRSRQALQRLTLTREAYRTALEAHKPAHRLELAYDAAQTGYAASQRELAAAKAEAAAAAPAAEAARRDAEARLSAALHRRARDSFLARLVFVLLAVAAGFWLLASMRRRQTRWLPLAGSVLACATILAFVLAADYLTDYFEPFQWGIAVISLLGIALTLAVYLGIQRYLLRRIPQRRVRKRQCPFCGYPVGANVHCEGCGREAVAPCTACEAPRRVGTTHCRACGATSR